MVCGKCGKVVSDAKHDCASKLALTRKLVDQIAKVLTPSKAISKQSKGRGKKTRKP